MEQEQTVTAPLSLYFDLQVPHGNRLRPALIGTHGYEGNKESMMRIVTQIAQDDMIAASLQGPYQFWTGAESRANRRVGFGWGTSYRGAESVKLHHHAMRQLIERLVEDHHADPERIFLLAFSQSCSYNYRFAFSHPGLVRGVIAVCGGIPSDWQENESYCRGLVHVLHIAATEDHWYSHERNERFRRDLPLRAASTDFRFYQSPHKFPRNAIPHIRKWIDERVVLKP